MNACPTCAEPLADGVRFCPQCGTPVGEGDTRRMELPPHETAPVPVRWEVAEPRYFGVTPASLLLVVTLALLAAAVVLFATGHWPLGLVCVGGALLAFAGFLEFARRKPDAPVARATGHALWSLRQRAQAVLESASVRSQASRHVAALRRESAELEAARDRQLLFLGYAAYRRDDEAVAMLREEVRAIEERLEGIDAELARVVAEAEVRVRQARLAVQPTEMVDIPEPYPPPDEGTPPTPAPVPEPTPAPVPEPYPPPDEGSPPAPPQVPEPGPIGPGGSRS